MDDAEFGAGALTRAYTLMPSVIVVSVEEPLSRSLRTIAALIRGNPRGRWSRW
ncbi:MAG: hypothetical protein JOY61_18075 [Chloroflexi bacterium]|nr:hypothetical protein [Chloroflexota bacterium]